MFKALHMALAILSVSGFVIRAVWSYGHPDLLTARWVRIAPHIVDTLLLSLGVFLAFQLASAPWQGWLGVKLIALFGYIVLGVLTLRGNGMIKHVSFAGALLCACYMFLVAVTRQVWFW